VTKLVVLGGSAVSTPQLAAALADAGLGKLELALVGRSAEKLRLVAAAARTAGGEAIVVSEHTDLEDALAGASIVLSQVRIGGLESRAFDERFSRDLGIPGEETVGPGGFASAWRTLPVVEALMRRVAKAAPGLLVLNLTNPASMVHRVCEQAGLEVITLCDAPLVLARKLARLIDADPTAAVPRYAGINHCGWITGLEINGEDRLGEVLEKRSEVAALTGIDEQVTARLGAVPNPYLRFIYHPERQRALQRAAHRTRAEELEELEREALSEYAVGADPTAAAARRPAPWYSECVVPLIAARRGECSRMIVDVANHGLLPYLPAETAIEVSAEVRNCEVKPLPVDPLPVEAVALLVQIATYDELSVEAILSGDRDGCVRALSVHPLVPSVDVAAELVQRIERRFGELARSRA
jgi:6-phospho-beta-glucosidase